MNILWSPEAIEDLTAYIAQDNPPAARGVMLHITHSIEQLLPSNPHVGRPGRVPGTRELVIPKTPLINASITGRVVGLKAFKQSRVNRAGLPFQSVDGDKTGNIKHR